MDALDRQLIGCLLEDGRASYAAIGDRIGLSAPAVKRRMDRLVGDGVISGFTVVIDPDLVGWSTEAYVEVHCKGTISPDELRAAFGRCRRSTRPPLSRARPTRSCTSWPVTSATSSVRWSGSGSRPRTSTTP